VTDAPGDGSAHARRWIAILLAAGVAWRLIRYGLAFPLWSDEAGLMLNLVERDGYADLVRPLDYFQVAPLGFLAAQLTALRLWGTSEYALRVVPLLSGVAALLLFARLAWLALPPLGAMAAVGTLGATHYVTRYALDIRPYGLDLGVACLLLLLGIRWSREPERRRWPVLLILVAPVALALSFPAVFVAGAVAAGVGPILWRRRAPPAEWRLLAAYVAVVTLAFAGLVSLSAGDQYAATRSWMMSYWSRAFPPANPLWLAVWLLDVHTAEMLSYPLGGKNGASAGTLLLCLVGVHALLARGQSDLLRLLGATFALTLAAAALRVYPYGGSSRVAQHLAPAVCLLAGAGIEKLVGALASVRARRRAATAAGVALLLLALGGMTRDVLHPYHTERHATLFTLMDAWRRDRGPESGVWVSAPLESQWLPFSWYVLRGVDGDRGRVESGPPEPARLARRREWWVFNGDPAREGDPSLLPREVLAGGGYALRETRRVVLTRAPGGTPEEIIELQRWERAN
jgi:hypothetical protein